MKKKNKRAELVTLNHPLYVIQPNEQWAIGILFSYIFLCSLSVMFDSNRLNDEKFVDSRKKLDGFVCGVWWPASRLPL